MTSGYNEGQSIQFTNTGWQYQTPSGNALFSVSAPASGANGVTVAAAASGGIPIIKASGTDSAIALAIRSSAVGAPIYLQSGGSMAMQFVGLSSSVNYLEAVSSVSGSPVQLAAVGSDTNIGIQLSPQGTGGIVLGTNATQVNGVTVSGNTTGNPSYISATGADSSIAMQIKSKATGSPLYLASGSLNVLELASVTGGINYLEMLDATTGNPALIAAQGGDSNVSIKLAPLGTGVVQISGSGLQLPFFTVSTLPTCGTTAPAGTIAYVTDATSPTYNATLTGSGAVKTLALCNGTNWTAH